MQRQIGLLLDPFLEPIGVRLKRRAPAARMRLGFGTALAAESLNPFDCGRGCDIETHRPANAQTAPAQLHG